MEIKATSTIYPKHAESLIKWKILAGNSAASEGVIVADVSEPIFLKGCQVIPLCTVIF